MTRVVEVLAAVRLVNIQLQKWCNRTRLRFIDLRKGWSDQIMSKNGTHYSPEGFVFVANRISTEAQLFLDQRHRRIHLRPRAKQPDRRYRAAYPKRKCSQQTDAATNQLQCSPAQAQMTQPQLPMTAPPILIHPLPGIFPWNAELVLPAMYHSVGELVKHHLMLATQASP
ncbi:hypothetical protein HPB50_009237 [Hyalomma asiaticum]|uniref:Uncharacterized protein n=1 Tax=Hyalomma asiaticum TaxID=266040 RepID=A0ACB7SPP0_HYAAI|nr:hypothetical protein HPB50_009237 [Hyalomma asiaticum]